MRYQESLAICQTFQWKSDVSLGLDVDEVSFIA